jgi:hypothetical protein
VFEGFKVKRGFRTIIQSFPTYRYIS